MMKETNRLRLYWNEFYGEELTDAQFYEYRNRLKNFLELLVRIKKRIDKEDKENGKKIHPDGFS